MREKSKMVITLVFVLFICGLILLKDLGAIQ